jgi:hypothetical protein
VAFTFLSNPPVVSFKKALFAAAILLIAVQGHAGPGSEGPFLGLSGYWSGAGTITMTNGTDIIVIVPWCGHQRDAGSLVA